jgi:TRAP-type C4-dicarboxylate transport system substrate-binding protein
MAGALSRIVARGRAFNWLALYEVGMFLYRHGKQRWDSLTPDERRRLGELLRKSKGRRSNLSAREQDRLWELVKKTAVGRS